MESHIMNVPYHHTRYRPIGHKIMRATSESLSSESSCTQNSPEYPQPQPEFDRRHYEEEQENDWNVNNNQAVNATQSSQDTSSDEEDEQIEVEEVHIEENPSDPVYDLQLSEADNSLVEGADYDVIQVYAVHPDLDLEVSSDDDEEEQADYAIQDKSSDVEYVSEDPHYRHENDQQTDTYHEGLNIDIDEPVVSNVDEYFIKDDKNILEVKDEPVVQDVDEYFIKHPSTTHNVDDFLDKVPDEIFHIDQPEPKAEEFFPPAPKVEELFPSVRKAKQLIPSAPKVEELFPPVVKKEEPLQEIEHDQINESDLEVLPNIEELKKFLLEDMHYSKLKNAQRSCSVPHSPMNICMDVDDAKTCLSFEDLNLDLSDLAFDDKDKSDVSAGKSDGIPRTLTEEDVNSFLIKSKPEKTCANIIIKTEDDLSHLDMDMDRPVESSIPTIQPPVVENFARTRPKGTSTPIPKPNVLDFCVEKPVVKKEANEIKTESDDFVDVESCNDTVIPVLAANNLSSLLEQFEATEKLNTKPKKSSSKSEDAKIKSSSKNSLTNGMRQQDAGVQLNKTKMRQILMPSTVNTAVRRSPSPVHSDHDYCTSKKRHSLPNLKGGQSLLKPEVLSSNNRILNSRHRSCKNKKIDYNLSSDEESEKCSKNKKVNKDDSDAKSKKCLKQPVKPPAQSTCRKKLSPPHSATNDSLINKANTVINKSACKASDTPCSQNSNGSIKLTIINKSAVILNNCDVKDSQKDNKHSEKHKNIVSDKPSAKSKSVKEVKDKDVDSNKSKSVNSKESVNPTVVKEEPRPKDENFYTALFPNKHDVQIPQAIKTEKRPFDEELQRISEITCKKESEQPVKKKKLNLQEYKLRRGVSSNNSSTTVSPEAIFPDYIPHLDKNLKGLIQMPNGKPRAAEPEAPKKIFDPIREASRKILMNTKKQKAEATRKRDEDIVMSKIPKVENLQLQPLISDAEMMKIVGMAPTDLPAPIVPEKPQALADYEEIILVSMGVNTDEKVFQQLLPPPVKRKSPSPPCDAKSLINFKIKKSDPVLKQNVFDTVKRDKRSPTDDKKRETKIDKERYKGITAALKSVEKHVDTKLTSNSLFASIQDVVMKKAPEENEPRHPKLISPTEKKAQFKYVKTTIVREYDPKVEHGEDKVILHLGKDRSKPTSCSIVTQTDHTVCAELSVLTANMKVSQEVPKQKQSRKRNDSDMSMSSEGSPVRPSKVAKIEEKASVKPKEVRTEKRSQSKEKRSRSKDRYESKYRRRSRSHSRRRRRSHSRSRSRSRGRYRRYRRSDSPYKRKRRSRSPYRRRSPSPRRSPSGRRSANDRRSPVRRSPSIRRSPSVRRDHRRSRSRSRHSPQRSKSPIVKKTKVSPQNSIDKKVNGNDKKAPKSMTPPLRKPTVSESSDSSTSSSSSSSSSSSDDSRESRRSCSPYKRDDYRKKVYRSFSSEDRDSNTPVEERRIVFVGKLEKDITKAALRSLFSKFGHVMEVRLHSKEDGSRYGFVTYQRARDAWSAVEAANTFPQYDVGFGGRRAFCRQSYADLDGLEAKYTESAFHGQAALPARRTDDMSFEQMLLDMKKKLSQRKSEKKRDDKP